MKILKIKTKTAFVSLSLIFLGEASPAKAFNLNDVSAVIKIVKDIDDLNLVPRAENNIFKICATDKYASLKVLDKDQELSEKGQERQVKAIDQTYSDCMTRANNSYAYK